MRSRLLQCPLCKIAVPVYFLDFRKSNKKNVLNFGILRALSCDVRWRQ